MYKKILLVIDFQRRNKIEGKETTFGFFNDDSFDALYEEYRGIFADFRAQGHEIIHVITGEDGINGYRELVENDAIFIKPTIDSSLDRALNSDEEHIYDYIRNIGIANVYVVGGTLGGCVAGAYQCLQARADLSVTPRVVYALTDGRFLEEREQRETHESMSETHIQFIRFDEFTAETGLDSQDPFPNAQP